jgi:hypothetical protein
LKSSERVAQSHVHVRVFLELAEEGVVVPAEHEVRADDEGQRVDDLVGDARTDVRVELIGEKKVNRESSSLSITRSCVSRSVSKWRNSFGRYGVQ